MDGKIKILTNPTPFSFKGFNERFTPRLRWGMGSVLVFLLSWEIIGNLGLVDLKYISRPSLVALSGYDWLLRGDFYYHLYISLLEIFVGFFFAVIFGVLCGLLIGRYRIISGLFDPLFMALYATPLVAVIPLLIMWFGIGIKSKMVVVFLFALFPILLNTITGIRQVDRLLLIAGRSFGATEWQLFTKILIPASLSSIITGIRLSWGRGLLAMVIGEMYVSMAGLGYLIKVLGANFQTSDLFFITIIVALLGFSGSSGFRLLERKVMVWKEEVHNK
jgi:ABC-type nitrate/sulfonate/bicarbonate transport system permease component